MRRASSCFSRGSRSTRMEMKMMLSMPSTQFQRGQREVRRSRFRGLSRSSIMARSVMSCGVGPSKSRARGAIPPALFPDPRGGRQSLL